MKRILPVTIISILLLVTYYYAYHILRSYYPMPHVSWDSNYYIRAAFIHDYGIRPSGYPFFLSWLYDYSHSLVFVLRAQFFLYLASTALFLYTLRRVLKLHGLVILAAGMILMLEPVALYHCNSILSDILFSSLTITAISFLLLFIHTEKYGYLLLHALLIFLCIEVRHIALFYPVFTCLAILLFTKRTWKTGLSIVVLLATHFALNKWHINKNKEQYGAAIYSPFSGWTHANNSLYTVRQANIKPGDIADPGIKATHEFILHSLDSTGLRIEGVGSGYLWDPNSPLNIMRAKAVDSLIAAGDSSNAAWYKSWYVLADKFGKWGLYIQKHKPGAYIETYMKPNIKTMLQPHTGEMDDYDVPGVTDSIVYKQYGVYGKDFSCIKQVYKESLNASISKWYTFLLYLLAAGIVLFLVVMKNMDKKQRNAVFTVLMFVAAFYGLTLYSSWFMYRYLLPVLPLMIAFAVILPIMFLTHIRKVVSKKPTEG